MSRVTMDDFPVQRPVKLAMAWQGWPAGHVFTDMPTVQAEAMVRAGQAEWGGEAPANRMIGGKGGKAGRINKGR